MAEEASAEPDSRRALAAGLGAYAFWGLVPLFFKLLAGVGADEIIAHRVIWSVLFLLVVLAVRNRGRLLSHLRVEGRTLLALSTSGALVAANWLLFVHAVNTDRVLSTSLGYFITPLVSMLLGALLLRERIGRVQGVAVLLAAAGTLYLALRLGQAPWLALGLAFSFGFYGLVRKLTSVGPMVGLFWETLLMSPVAAGWLLWISDRGELAFLATGPADAILLALTGLVTVIPLVLFAVAARGLPLITVGVLQYIAPSISFCLAVFLFGERFTSDHAVAFAAIWTALAIYSASGLRRARQARRLARAQALH